MRERLVAGAVSSFVAASAAALICFINGFDFVIVVPLSAVAGALLGFALGPRIGHLFLGLVS